MAHSIESREEARQLVENIFLKKHGNISRQVLESMSLSTRLVVETAMATKDGLIGSSITTLAKHLYSSRARFVFELVQNAEDNSYGNTTDDPYISFQVSPHKIVIECNEDGFTERNVEAICAVGESSKAGARSGYIGEKGIGFKSVFMVASEVHIQSGFFSFCFKHHPGDSGMGMVNPIWQELNEEHNPPFTRITLTLTHLPDPSEHERQRKLIYDQFRDLPLTLLLFLKKLKRIEVKYYEEEGALESHVVYSSSPEVANDQRITLTKTEYVTNLPPEVVSKTYWKTNSIAHSLAGNDNRTYTEEEIQTAAFADAEIVLAFPIDKDDVPIIERQDVFAFLPIRDFGFSFLINSDFVTQAARQDIKEDSLRNIGLRKSIAEAFVTAVLQFCSHPTLQYQWMRYLPGELVSGDFWPDLLQNIKKLMDTTPVLRPRSGGALRLIKDMRRLSSMAKDRNLDPLFCDLPMEAYLAKPYKFTDLDKLSDFGLIIMGKDEVLQRIQRDLESATSRLKTTMDQDWHSRAAKLLSHYYFTYRIPMEQKIKELKIVPLENDTWVSVTEAKPIYFSNTDIVGLSIPRDLKLKLVKDEAVRNPDRKALFDYLDIVPVPPETVRQLIIEKYNGPFSMYTIKLKSSIAHLRYLYYTHSTQSVLPPSLGLYNQHESIISPSLKDIYLKIPGLYQTRELLKSIEPGVNTIGAPGFKVSFLHAAYFESPPSSTDTIYQHALSWQQWLANSVGTLQRPRFRDRSKEGLSPVFHYIARHRPGMLLGTLKKHWSSYQHQMTSAISTELAGIEVLCEGPRKVVLSKSYLPMPDLKEIAGKFLTPDENFPFLQLRNPPREESHQAWEFLEKFGVGTSSSLDFYLAILDCIIDKNPEASFLPNPKRVFQLYEAIQNTCWESQSNRKTVGKYFKNKRAIHFIEESGEASWIYPKECLWQAPADMISKKPLLALCRHRYFDCNSNTSETFLTQFFCKTLEILDPTYLDLITELYVIKMSAPGHLTRLPDIYHQMYEMIKNSDEDASDTREYFEMCDCIYIPRKAAWYQSQSCVWSRSAGQITGRVTVNNDYPDLEEFFVTCLGIKVTTLDMLMDEFVTLAENDASIDAFKDNIWNFNSLLANEESPPEPETLSNVQILPTVMPNRTTKLQKPSFHFAIVDRQKLGDMFRGKAALLDFTLQEVRRLHPFLQWLKIEDRYLSYAVKEISTFGGGNERVILASHRNVRSKAHALFRCAVHYNSPRVSPDDQTLYQLLSNTTVYETDDISSSLVLSQNGRAITVEVEKSLLAIKETKIGLNIYLPRDRRSQELSFIGKLPERLLEYIMTNPDTGITEDATLDAVKVIGNILQCSPHVVNDILEEEGIVPVELSSDMLSNSSSTTIDVAENEEFIIPSVEFTPDNRDTQSPGLQTPIALSSVLQGSTRSTSLLVSSTTHEVLEVPSDSARSPSPSSGPQVAHIISSSTPQLSVPGIQQLPIDLDFRSNVAYKRLLEWVVEVARSTTFPTKGTVFNMNNMQSALRSGFPGQAALAGAFGVRIQDQQEHDKRIGAAGELFTFELLKKLNTYLPGFSELNWQSTIRKYATAHDDYCEMLPWHGTETADLVYLDNTGSFTKFLVEKGYLSGSHWENATPKYFFEVKTTFLECKTRFFMSDKQHERMKDATEMMRDGSGYNVDNVYIIFRIFNVDKETLDVKVYVDPQKLKEEGELCFTADKWMVTPR